MEPIRTDYKTYLYLRSRRVVRREVEIFCRSRPWFRPDDLEADSHSLFMHLVDRYDPDVGAEFETYLKKSLRRFLLSCSRAEARRTACHCRVSNKDMALVADGRCNEVFDFEGLMSEIGEDAKAVVSLVFNTPSDVARMLTGFGEWTPDAIRESLFLYLTTAGWAADRVWSAFDRIKAALSG